MPRIEEIKEKATPILKSAGASRASIFGSYARGEENEKSDVDILIEAPDDMSLLDLAHLQILLQEALGKEVDILTYGGINPRVEPYIMKDLIPIY